MAKMQSVSLGTPMAAVLLTVAALVFGWVNPASSKTTAKAGWQPVGSFDVPTDQTNQHVGMNCPTAFPVVHSGAFAMNSVGQASNFSLSFNGPRIDEMPPDFAAWGWHFFWPDGAPAGITILFDVYCEKK